MAKAKSRQVKAAPKKKSASAVLKAKKRGENKKVSKKAPSETVKPPLVPKPMRLSAEETNDPLCWKKAFVLGEKVHADNKARVLEGVPGTEEPWDFSHLPDLVRSHAQKHDVYLVGGQPEPFNDVANMSPTIVIIEMPRGKEPPSLAAIVDGQQATDTIVPMTSLKLEWKPVSFQHDGDGRVFSLYCTLRPAVMKTMSEEALLRYEYACLFTMRPETDWIRKPNGDLDIQYAMFDYDKGRDGLITEEYTKGAGLQWFINDFCFRHELDHDEHGDSVKLAIRDSFAKAREAEEERIRLFDNYDPEVLNSMNVVKVYPRNDVIVAKTSYVNKFYGKAQSVI